MVLSFRFWRSLTKLYRFSQFAQRLKRTLRIPICIRGCWFWFRLGAFWSPSICSWDRKPKFGDKKIELRWNEKSWRWFRILLIKIECICSISNRRKNQKWFIWKRKYILEKCCKPEKKKNKIRWCSLRDKHKRTFKILWYC